MLLELFKVTTAKVALLGLKIFLIRQLTVLTGIQSLFIVGMKTNFQPLLMIWTFDIFL